MRRPSRIPSAWFAIVLLFGLGGFTGRLATAQDGPFALEGGERIVFLGDSITQAGHYVVDVELFLMTRFPDREFTVINHGISSETVSGLSEPDHPSARPNALDRFERDVNAWKPDVLVACFGMNDGIYAPLDDERFARYQKGIRTLIAGAREAGARVVILTPPPFDPYRRRASDPEAVHYGYRFPYIAYDDVLGHYAEWLMTLRGEDLRVADVHSATNRHLQARRRERVSFHLAPDAVHPDATGHWLMAQTLLLAWNAPAAVAEARIDAASKRAEAGDVRDLATNEGGEVRFTWRTPLPYPMDPECDPESIRLEHVSGRLNRQRLTVTGLAPGHYRLLARAIDRDEAGDEEPEAVGEFSAEELAAGLDLTALPDFPTTRIAQAARMALETHRGEMYKRWRAQVADEAAANDSAADPADAPATASIRRLCRPRDLAVRLVPIER